MNRPPSAALDDAVAAFVADLVPEVEALASSVARIDTSGLRSYVVVDAYNLSCGFIDADGLHTDDELWALIGAFGPRMKTGLARATPRELRDSGLVAGSRSYLERPSTLLDILVRSDARDGGGRTGIYARRAAQIGHAVASLDLLPSRTELDAIERFRAMVQRTLDAARAGSAPWPAAGGSTLLSQPSGGPVADAGAALPAGPAPRGTAGRARRPHRPARGQARGPPGGQPAARATDSPRARPPGARGQPSPDLHGQPRDGEDHRARLLAQIYRTLGVVERGHLVETDRSGLVAGFVGQTAGRVVAAFDRADEGVLLIDEAYSLTRGGENDFGREAIDMIVKLVEDRRERLVVILAGYPEEMAALVDANPGMRSRFPRTIHFPDYSDEELLASSRRSAARAATSSTTPAAGRCWTGSPPSPETPGSATGGWRGTCSRRRWPTRRPGWWPGTSPATRSSPRSPPPTFPRWSAPSATTRGSPRGAWREGRRSPRRCGRVDRGGDPHPRRPRRRRRQRGGTSAGSGTTWCAPGAGRCLRRAGGRRDRASGGGVGHRRAAGER